MPETTSTVPEQKEVANDMERELTLTRIIDAPPRYLELGLSQI
jgi:hypothetical protein